MAQNLKAAMAMEKVYRKLQDNRTAKDNFGYQDKLKSFGFADTVEYEQAKAENDLKTKPIDVQYWQVSTYEELDAYNKAREQDIKLGNNVLRFVTTTVPQVYIGVDCIDADRQYCEDNKLLVYPCPGKSAFVTSEFDLQICLTHQNHNLGKLLFEKLRKALTELGLDCEISGNDILVAGNKIVGSADWDMGLVSYYGYGITFQPDYELIDAVCHKPRTKVPRGISEVSDIKRDDLVEKVKSWLQ